MDGALGEGVGDDDLDLDLGQEVDGVLAAAIELGVAFLASVAARLEHGDAFDADLDQGVLDLFELGRLDDGFNLLHGASLFHF